MMMTRRRRFFFLIGKLLSCPPGTADRGQNHRARGLIGYHRGLWCRVVGRVAVAAGTQETGGSRRNRTSPIAHPYRRPGESQLLRAFARQHSRQSHGDERPADRANGLDVRACNTSPRAIPFAPSSHVPTTLYPEYEYARWNTGTSRTCTVKSKNESRKEANEPSYLPTWSTITGSPPCISLMGERAVAIFAHVGISKIRGRAAVSYTCSLQTPKHM